MSNALVSIDEIEEFLTTAVNVNTVSKILPLPKLFLQPLQNYSLNNFNVHEEDGALLSRERAEIKEELRLDHLNEGERELITKLYLQYYNIFYLEGDDLSFAVKVKHQICQ